MRQTLGRTATALMILVAGCSEGSQESVLAGVEAIVFVKRPFIQADNTHNVNGGNNQTIDYLRYTPGSGENVGGVFVLSPPTPGGTLTNLTAEFTGVDINGIDLSFDATKVVFSMRREGDGNYHLYLANVDGSGEVQQLTFGDYDDVKPIFVPGDRIAFVTNQPYTNMGTRADEYNHSRVVTQLATISETMGDADRRVCSQNLSHSADPFLLSDGRVAFSRWEHLGPVNDVKLFAMNPDCTQMVALAGQHGKPGNSLVQFDEVAEGQFVGIVTSRERTIQAGALIYVDNRSTDSTTGALHDEQTAAYQVLTPEVPLDEESPASGVGRYRTPAGLPGTSDLLVSWANGDVNDRNELAGTAPNFGLYRWDASTGTRTLVYDDENMWDLYATPVVARDAPPVFPGVVGPSPNELLPTTIGSVDVRITSLPDLINGGQFDGTPLSEALQQAKAVRIIEGFSSEIGPVRQFGLTMHEGAAILGEVPVYDDGSWLARVPARIPYHLQVIDQYGMSIRSEGLWIQSMPGEQRQCGGCHEARDESVLPPGGVTTLAQQAAGTFDPASPPDPFDPASYAGDLLVTSPLDRYELPWIGGVAYNAGVMFSMNGTRSAPMAGDNNVQAIFDAKCVSCHTSSVGPFAGMTYTATVTLEDGTTQDYPIPYLDLSSTPVTTYYEMEVVTYPASYVSLLYPSISMMDASLSGTIPPMWVTPASARTSRLIEKININSIDDPGVWAFPLTGGQPHPEDRNAGVSLTREERLTLIRMADLGGQYYSRRNVEGGFVEYPVPY